MKITSKEWGLTEMANAKSASAVIELVDGGQPLGINLHQPEPSLETMRTRLTSLEQTDASPSALRVIEREVKGRVASNLIRIIFLEFQLRMARGAERKTVRRQIATVASDLDHVPEFLSHIGSAIAESQAASQEFIKKIADTLECKFDLVDRVARRLLIQENVSATQLQSMYECHCKDRGEIEQEEPLDVAPVHRCFHNPEGFGQN